MTVLCSPFSQAFTEVKEKYYIPSTGKDQRPELKTSPATTQSWTWDRTLQYSFPYRGIQGEIFLRVYSTSDFSLHWFSPWVFPLTETTQNLCELKLKKPKSHWDNKVSKSLSSFKKNTQNLFANRAIGDAYGHSNLLGGQEITLDQKGENREDLFLGLSRPLFPCNVLEN